MVLKYHQPAQKRVSGTEWTCEVHCLVVDRDIVSQAVIRLTMNTGKTC